MDLHSEGLIYDPCHTEDDVRSTSKNMIIFLSIYVSLVEASLGDPVILSNNNI